MARKTKEEASQTREAILDAAEQVFHESGVSRSSLEAIATRAGCTRGAVYWHFESKRDVLQALVARVDALISERSETMRARSVDDPMGAMRDYLLFMSGELLEDEHAVRILDIAIHRCEYVDEMRGLLEYYGNHNKSYEQSVLIYQRAQQLGQIRADVRPEVCATVLQMTLEGMIRTRLVHPVACEMAPPNSVVIDFLLRSFGYDCAPAPAASARSAPVSTV